MIVALIYFALITAIIYRARWFTAPGLSNVWITSLFVIKVLAGFCLVLIYTYYYDSRETSDVYKYFDDGMILFGALKTNPADYFKMLLGLDNAPHIHKLYYSNMESWYRPYETNMYNDSRVMIRFNAFMALLSQGRIYAHVVFFSFISFSGGMLLYKALHSLTQKLPVLLSFAVFLIPSVCLWSSAPLKEAVVLWCLGSILYAVFVKHQSWLAVLRLTIACMLLYLVKFYILFAIALPLLGLALTHYTRWTTIKAYSIVFGTGILVLIGVESMSDGHLVELLSTKQADFIRMANYYESGSRFYLPPLTPDYGSFFSILPVALVTGLFRPWLWETNSLLALVPAIEMHLIWLGVIFAFIFREKRSASHWNKIIFILSFTCVLATIIGFATPVFGALVRYRVPFLPFLGWLMILLADEQKLVNLKARILGK